jgi:hypothetical protein
MLAMLPAHRLIYLRMIADGAPEECAALAHAVTSVLSAYGEVSVTEQGPYWKEPGQLELMITLEARETTGECIAALQTLAPDGWDDSPVGPAWQRTEGDRAFLHPAVAWVTLSPEEAAVRPAFTHGDIVRIRDCPTARAENAVGLEGEVFGRSVPTEEYAYWGYGVTPAGHDLSVDFAETELEATGRRVPPADTGDRLVISVTPEGEVTGWYGGSGGTG